MAESTKDLQQSNEGVLREIAGKLERLRSALRDTGAAAIQLQRTENLAWLTAGRVDRRVLLPSATGIATAFILSGGDAFYLAPNNEARRLAEEDFVGLPFTAVSYPWHTDELPRQIIHLAGTERVLSDQEPAGAALMQRLRAALESSEIERYRWLGRATADATAALLLQLAPGDSERSMAARLSAELIERGIEPTVLLMAVDDRILHYKHAVAQNRVLAHYGMLNLCTRRWGLCISITRFVHFGPLPQSLADAFGVAAEVNARLLAATQEGATAADLYATAAAAYADHGHPGEEQQHHQGGATGYGEREWIATPHGRERIVDNQAFAWNPSVAGGKVEDTVLLRAGRLESLTSTPALPVVKTRAGILTIESAGVLVR